MDWNVKIAKMTIVTHQLTAKQQIFCKKYSRIPWCVIKQMVPCSYSRASEGVAIENEVITL